MAMVATDARLLMMAAIELQNIGSDCIRIIAAGAIAAIVFATAARTALVAAVSQRAAARI